MKDDLKLSQYNVYHQYDSDGKKFLLVYNSFTKKMISVENYSSIFSPISLINKLLESSQNEAVFKDLGMLVDKDVHEFNSAHFECIRKIFSNDILKITIIPTDDCNFRCVYCYQDSEKHYINSDTEQRIIRYLEKNVRNFKTLYIGWFGGEPLLCKKTIISMSKKIKDICKKNNVVFYSSVTTNGYELDIETFKAFIKLGIRYFQITLDGDIETHNFQRPHRTNNNSFQKIYSNLQEIKTLPPNFRFEIGIRINVSRLNFPNMFEFINNRLIYFKNDSRFKIIWQWVRDWGGDRITGYKDSLLCSKNLCHDLIKETCQKGLESYESLTHSSGIDHCEAVFYNGYVIDYLGRVLKCSLKTQSSSDIETNCIGYINDSGKMVLEKNREYKWFNLMPPSKCMECNIYPMCMSQSCPLSNATTQCPKCVEFKELIPSILESIHISKKCTSIIFPGE